MTILLRRTRNAAWIGEKRSLAAATKELERNAEDTDGLSVFEVDGEAQLMLVAAAIACGRANDGRVDFIEIERAELERYGAIDETRGTTPLEAANQLHRSLDWDPATLRRLSEDLFKAEAKPRSIPPNEVRRIVAGLDASQVLGDEARAFVAQIQQKQRQG